MEAVGRAVGSDVTEDHPRWVYAVLAVAALVVGACWAVSSPVGSTSDDDYHLATIWCSTGDPELCGPIEENDQYFDTAHVPAGIAAMHCFRQNPEISASCGVDTGSALVPSRVKDGLYPWGFHWFLSSFATTSVEASVLAMRLAALLVALTAFGVCLWAAPTLRKSQILAWAVASVPMGLFVYPSTNPSSWSSVGLACLLPATYALFRPSGPARFGGAIVAFALSMALVMASRADVAAMAALFLSVAIVAFSNPHQRPLAPFLCLLAVIVSMITYLTSDQRRAGDPRFLSGREANYDLDVAWQNLWEVPKLWAGVLGEGSSALGWTDTPVPSASWIGIAFVVSGLTYQALRVVGPRKALLLSVTVTMLVLLPMYVLTQQGVVVGEIVQARYLLPLVLLAVGLALAPLPGSQTISLTRAQAAIGSVVSTLAGSLALHGLIRRYVTGIDVAGPNLNEDVEWWSIEWASPMVVWLVGTVATGVVFHIAFRLNRGDVSGLREVPSVVP